MRIGHVLTEFLHFPGKYTPRNGLSISFQTHEPNALNTIADPNKTRNWKKVARELAGLMNWHQAVT
jgi:hypothetical protein